MAVKVEGLTGLLRHVGAVQAKAKDLDRAIVIEVAGQAKAVVLSIAATDIPGRKLSRFNNGRGITLNANYQLNTGPVPTALLLPTPPGPWYLLEHGGKAHQIGKRVAGKRRGRRNQAGFLGDASRGFAAYGPVQHPDFKAKHTWMKAAAAAEARGSTFFRGAAARKYIDMFAG